MPEQHTILGGKVYVYKRPNSRLWQCSTYLAGKNRRISTKEESLAKAKEIAEDWYLKLRGKLRSGEIKTEKTFREVSEHYLHEYDIMTQGQRNQRYVDGQHWRSSLHLVPFFRNLGISEINRGKDPGIPSAYSGDVNAEHQEPKKKGFNWEAEQLHDFVLRRQPP